MKISDLFNKLFSSTKFGQNFECLNDNIAFIILFIYIIDIVVYVVDIITQVEKL